MSQAPNDIELIRITPDENEPRLLGLKYVIGGIGLKLVNHSSETEVQLRSNDGPHPQVELIRQFYSHPETVDLSTNTALLYIDHARHAIRDEGADNRAAVVNKMLMGAWATAYESTIDANTDIDLAQRSLEARYAFALTEAMDANDPQRDIVLSCVIDELSLAESPSLVTHPRQENIVSITNSTRSALGPLSRSINQITLARAKHDIGQPSSVKDHLEIAKELLDHSRESLSLDPHGMTADRILRDATQKLYDEINYFESIYSSESATTTPQRAA